ncbi:MAG: Clp protease ClpP, partial [Oscillospiraceae bacterium]|nr:Clp protease ClpP [Oscillospiraceae bacterium]
MHKNMWEIRQEAESADALELYIYDTVESDGWWYDSDTSAKHFRDELAKHPNAKEITVYINSLGGSVMEGIAIYNQLKRHPAHKTVRIDGFACSIASVIAMAGDTIIMPKNTVMMIHNAWTIAIGNSKELH